MSQYYYAVSTLPALSFGGESSFSSQDFMNICENWLSPVDLSLLSRTRLGAEAEVGLAKPMNSLLVRWFTFENTLRNEMANQRGLRSQRDPIDYLRRNASGEIYTGYGRVSEIIRNAVQETNPLQGERTIDQLRWDFLDELSLSHFFDIEALQVYYLRLQLVERQNRFKQEAGVKGFKNNYDQVATQLTEDGGIQTGLME